LIPVEGPLLSKDELQTLSSCDASRIERYIGLGLVTSQEEGAFERGDVTRIRVLAALEASGVDLRQVAKAVHQDRFSLAFAGEVVADSVGLTPETHQQVISRLGLDSDFARRLELAIGLPTSSPDDLIREDDRELLGLVARAREAGLEEENLARILRVFGISVRQIIDAQRQLFRENIEEQLLAQGATFQEMLDTTARTRLDLQRLGFRTIYLLLRRFLEQAVIENLVERLEQMLEEHGIARASDEQTRVIVFIDLTGYTASTEASGDRQAAEQGGRLVEIAQDICARYAGRLVKSLGDGVMLRFREAELATLAALEILKRSAEAGLSPARAGIAAGPVIERDGDYFGRTVNVASRLLDLARPGQVVVTAEAADQMEDGSIALDHEGEHELSGVTNPTSVFVARLQE
jgi:adenylate cyclase